MNLKQQDIYIILKLLALRGGKWTYAGLSGSLLLSASEANAAVKRATQCGLMRPALGTEVNPQPIAAAVLEFLAHGIRYVFPAQTGGLVRGVVTGFAAPGLENLIAETGEPVAVWPSAQGAYRGYSLSPLYHRAPEAVQADPRFHAYLALADVLREASARGRETAVRRLGAMIGEDDPTSPLGPTPQTP
jgi:hypothetical protein